jgi:tetratricopeptide (TPR) repeat protein
MKISLLLILSVLIGFTVLPSAGETLATGISSAAATTDSPPHNVSVYILDARAAVAERNWTHALLLTTRGSAFYPDNADLLCLQGYTYRKLGQYTKSVDVVSKGILLDPKPVRYANRGYGYLALKNYSAAFADAETGLMLDASYPSFYGIKALALQGLGRTDEARAAIDTAIALQPDNAHYWHVKGNLLASQGNCTGAASAWEKSLAIDPGYDLPYPGFASANERLVTLNTSCTSPGSGPSPAQASAGAIAAISIIGGALVLRLRK